MRLRWTAALALALALPAPAAADPAGEPPAALKRLSLDELFNVKITSVSKRAEPLAHSASAIQVITRDDILRSGATNLPEALRLATNLTVAQVNAHSWAVTARGFSGAAQVNGSLANKLLVLIDGRSVYSPLFAGVFWSVQDVLLEDVDRIEVISGPGGTLWGANAVNGVINVVTKSALDTRGVYATGAVGSQLQNLAAVRYGGGVGERFAYRAYAKRFEHDATEVANGTTANDAWYHTQGGFRTEYRPTGQGTLTVQGDLYDGRENTKNPSAVDGQNVMARWTQGLSASSDLSVQLYYDRAGRDRPTPIFREVLQTVDLDMQHRFALGPQGILWGATGRWVRDDTRNSAGTGFNPPLRDLRFYGGFVQYELPIVQDRLRLVAGSKFEHHEYSGLEVQPGSRLAWTLSDRHTLWASVSRAVRAPSRLEMDITSPGFGVSPDFASEKVTAYEAGWRSRPWNRVSLSWAGSWNRYDDLRSIDTNPSAPPAMVWANDLEGRSWSVEGFGTIQVTDTWRLRSGYSHFVRKITPTSSAVVSFSEVLEGVDPRNTGLIQSILDLPHGVQVDLVARYVDPLPKSLIMAKVPAYTSLDARLGWQVRPFEVSVVGQNLLDDRHPEFLNFVDRSVHGRVTWRY